MKHTKTHCELLGFDDRRMLWWGIPISGLLISFMLFNQYYLDENWPFIAVCIPISIVYTAIFWLTLRFLYYHIKLRYPDVSQIRTRLLLILGLFIIVFFVINFILDNLFAVIFPFHISTPNHIVEFISSMVVSALAISIYEGLSFYIQLQRTSAEKAELERHFFQSQLEGLRAQVNPHFLFNSLNTLTYLIPENRQRAVVFVQKLSKVYRYMLESRHTNLIPLSDELDFLDAYVHLLRERFGENIHVQINADNTSRDVIPPLALQILFENAIKHNIISTEKPLSIEVAANEGAICVKNNIQLKNQVADSTGVGLENIRARYALLSEHAVTISDAEGCFTVCLPRIFQK